MGHKLCILWYAFDCLILSWLCMALLYLVRSSIVPPLNAGLEGTHHERHMGFHVSVVTSLSEAPPAVIDEVTGYTIYLADSAGSTVDRVTLGMSHDDGLKSQHSAKVFLFRFALTSASMLQAL